MTLGEYQGVNVSQCYVANCQKIFQDATASTASGKPQKKNMGKNERV
jgi:hypothetical protein